MYVDCATHELCTSPVGKHDSRLMGSCDPVPPGGDLPGHLAARPLHQLKDRRAAVRFNVLTLHSRFRTGIRYLELLSPKRLAAQNRRLLAGQAVGSRTRWSYSYLFVHFSSSRPSKAPCMHAFTPHLYNTTQKLNGIMLYNMLDSGRLKSRWYISLVFQTKLDIGYRGTYVLRIMRYKTID